MDAPTNEFHAGLLPAFEGDKDGRFERELGALGSQPLVKQPTSPPALLDPGDPAKSLKDVLDRLVAELKPFTLASTADEQALRDASCYLAVMRCLSETSGYLTNRVVA